MNQIIDRCKKLFTGSGGLTLVALTVLITVGLMPAMVSAHDSDPATFTSPLDRPPRGDHAGIDEELRETLDAIIDRDALLAEVLGITLEELAAAKEDGISLHELIDEAGLDKATVHAEIQSAVEAALQQAVTDGLLTQEQADLVLNPPAHPANDGQREQGPRREHGRPEGDKPEDDASDDETGDDATTTPSEDSPVTETTTVGATTTEADESEPAGDPNHHRPHRGPDTQNNDAQNNNEAASSEVASDAEASSADNNPHDQSEGNRRPRH